MKKPTQSTKSQKESEIKREWHLVDMDKKILGRVTTEISKLLQGKHKSTYVPYLDCGDYVVVINAERVELSGKKAQTKTYTRYSGYPGGQTKTIFEDVLRKNPAEIIRHAVSGMLPKNKLRARRLTRLYVYRDDKHPYADKFKKDK